MLSFVGVPLATLLKVGAALGALVVGLYILKLKRRPILVPFAALWQRVLRDKEATTLFSQLKRLLSLLMQLALLAAMLLALGDPRTAINENEGRHVVVLVDASASMKAVDVPQPTPKPESPKTRLDLGKKRLKEIVRGLSGSDRMLVVQLDASVTPRSTMTSDVPVLLDAVTAVRSSDTRANLAQGLRFAMDALSGRSEPEIVLVSDGALGEAVDGMGQVDLGKVKLSHLRVGQSNRNVAITGFSVRRYPLDKSRYEVLIEVANTSDKEALVDLELFGDGELTDIVALKLQPNESLSRFYPNLSGADKTLEAVVKLKGQEPDQLPSDDRAYALLPERRRARVQVVTTGNMYLEAALLLDEYLAVQMVTPDKYPAKGQFDVTIFDGVAPPLQPQAGHVLYLAPDSDEHTPFALGRKLKSSRRFALGFDETSKHPVLRNVTLGDVNIKRGRALKRRSKKDKILGRSFRGALMLAGKREGRRFVALGFDVRNSDLVLRIAWPMLLLNTINAFLDEEVGYISSFRTGDVWRIPAEADKKTHWLQLPNGSRRLVPVKDGKAVYLGQSTGFYRMLAHENASSNGSAPAGLPKGIASAASSKGQAEFGVRSTMFAANMADVEESSIAPVKEFRVNGVKAGPVRGFEAGVRRELWIYFLLAVLGATLFEWLSYHRRLTV